MYPIRLKNSKKEIFLNHKNHCGTYWGMWDHLISGVRRYHEVDDIINTMIYSKMNESTQNEYAMSSLVPALPDILLCELESRDFYANNLHKLDGIIQNELNRRFEPSLDKYI